MRKWFILLIFFSGVIYANIMDNTKSLNKTDLIGLVTQINKNNFDLSIENNGAIGHSGDAYYPSGTSLSFLFSGGIGISAYDENNNLRISWIFPSSRIYGFMAGKFGMDPDDAKAKFYYVNSEDGFGSNNYIEWANAVALGADFVDVDSNGVYDPTIDKPDLLGQFTVWYVTNDSLVSGQADFVNRQRVGVEVYHTIFGFYGWYGYGDVLFFRYRIKNVSTNHLNNAIFSFLADTDIGDYADDLTGCDPIRNLGYSYNYGNDNMYGNNPPAVGIDLLQGAIVNSPGDTAYIHSGPAKGIQVVPDKRNLPMSSFSIMIPGSQVLNDPQLPSEGRYYMEGGYFPNGDPIDPSDFYPGSSNDPSSDPKFLFDGNPVDGTGWLNTLPTDYRFLVNNGPFSLNPGEEQEIIMALIVKQGSDALNSVAELLDYDDKVQQLYEVNFDILKLMDISEDSKQLPQEFVLGDPYPNPFNPVTHIPVQLHGNSVKHLKVSIFDVTGKKIWSTELHNLTGGRYVVTWDGTDERGDSVPSGIYFVRVIGDRYTESRKIILQK